MKRLLALVVCAFSIQASAQLISQPCGYNPDVNGDMAIGLPDLLSFLSVYGQDLILAAPSSNEYTLALYEAGQYDRGKCLSECLTVGGRIPMAAELLLWDSTLLQLPFNAPFGSSNPERIEIWAYDGYTEARQAAFTNTQVIRHHPTADDGWSSWILSSATYTYPSYCFCIGHIPNPEYIPE